MDVCRVPRRRAFGRRGIAASRCEERRSRGGVVANRTPHGAHLVCRQLPGRRVRAVEYGVSRRRPRARRQLICCRGHDRASPTRAAARGSAAFAPARGNRGRWQHRFSPSGADRARRVRALRRRGRTRRQRRDRSLGHPVDHLHLGHDGLFEGCAVAVPAALLHGNGRLRLRARRRVDPREPAHVPHRGHQPDVLRTGPGRQHLPGRRLQHDQVLGPGAPRQLRDAPLDSSA